MIKYLDLPLFSTEEKMRIKIINILCSKKTKYQYMLIVDTYDFGKCLILDEIMQCSEGDHNIYDNEMLKMLKKTDEELLILGGGDGYVAEEALKRNPALKIKILELDPEVISASKKYLGQKVFDNVNVDLHIGDALHYLKNIDNIDARKYDGVVCDLTGEPITPDKKEEFEYFYNELIELSGKVLKKDGWIALQAGDSEVGDKYIEGVKVLEVLLEKEFNDVERSDIMIPSYGENDSFLFGKVKISFDDLYKLVDHNIDCIPGCNICEDRFMQFLPNEIQWLSKKHQILKNKLANEHTIRGKNVWMIKNDEDDCCFYQNGRCDRREMRPLDCRTYPVVPFLDNGKMGIRLDDKCPLVKNKMVDNVFVENASRAWELSRPPKWWLQVYQDEASEE